MSLYPLHSLYIKYHLGTVITHNCHSKQDVTVTGVIVTGEACIKISFTGIIFLSTQTIVLTWSFSMKVMLRLNGGCGCLLFSQPKYQMIFSMSHDSTLLICRVARFYPFCILQMPFAKYISSFNFKIPNGQLATLTSTERPVPFLPSLLRVMRALFTEKRDRLKSPLQREYDFLSNDLIQLSTYLNLQYTIVGNDHDLRSKSISVQGD